MGIADPASLKAATMQRAPAALQIIDVSGAFELQHKINTYNAIVGTVENTTAIVVT